MFINIFEHISLGALSKAYSADKSMLCRWVKEFIGNVEAAFPSKKHLGNRFAALYTGNNLTEIERLRLTAAKLEAENDRLKKDI